MANNYIYAIGRRKTATAQVKLFSGTGKNTINGKPVETYVSRPDLFDSLFSAIKLCALKDKVYFDIQVDGSGEASQVGAMSLGLSRAIASQDLKFRTSLKEAGLLTRDARKVERKKPGLHKARKATQWSKR